MDSIKIRDLYTAAFLKARDFECEVDLEDRKCVFVFPIGAKIVVDELANFSKAGSYNVNANRIINEIRQLKSYVYSLNSK